MCALNLIKENVYSVILIIYLFIYLFMLLLFPFSVGTNSLKEKIAPLGVNSSIKSKCRLHFIRATLFRETNRSPLVNNNENTGRCTHIFGLNNILFIKLNTNNRNKWTRI